MKRITGKKPIKKKKEKNIKVIVIVTIISISVVVFIAIRLLPTVRKIEVTIDTSVGSYITQEKVSALSGVKVGDKLYRDLRSTIAKRIEENPYVKQAKVKRYLSGKVKIEILQRKPEYMISYNEGYIYIDREGYLLEVNTASIEKTIIAGFSTDFSKLSIGNTKIRLNQKDLEKLDIVNNILASFKNNNIENKVNSIDITDKKDFVLFMGDEGKEVHIGDGSDINTRILYMKEVLEIESGHTGIIYINGNLDEGYVYFREQ